jgi:hypothetical protein
MAPLLPKMQVCNGTCASHSKTTEAGELVCLGSGMMIGLTYFVFFATYEADVRVVSMGFLDQAIANNYEFLGNGNDRKMRANLPNPCRKHHATCDA